jgi:O-antigen ligase
MNRTIDRVFVDCNKNRNTSEDGLFQALVCLAMLLEIVVFVEPAPVDAAILFCIGLCVLLGKFSLAAVGNLPLISLTVFVLANLISMYDPLDPDRALWYVLVTLYLVGSWFFFVGLIGRYGQPIMARLINTYCFAGLLSAVLGVGGYFHLLPFQDLLLTGGRARGLFKDPNVYGPYLVPVALFALTWSAGAIGWRLKAAFFSLFLVTVAAILLCFSRACWINFAVALIVFFAGQLLLPGAARQVRRRLRVAAVAVAVSAVAVVLLLNIPAARDMLAQRVTSSGLQNYDRIRFATQSLALETAEQRPLGIGPGQSEVLFNYSTHSMYLRVLSENGSIALLALLIFIGATMARSITLIRQAENPWLREINVVVLATIAGHLVNSFVIDTVHWRHIWFIYSLPWVSAQLRESSPFLRRRVLRLREFRGSVVIAG